MPAFYAENNDPRQADSEQRILQKILGSIQDQTSAGVPTSTGTAILAAVDGLESKIPDPISGASPVAGQGFVSSASTTRPNDTTPYSALDVVGQSPAANLEFTGVGAAGTDVFITGASLRVDVAAIPAGVSTYRLHLYDAAPTAITDNATYNLPSTDRAKYLGYIEIGTPEDLGDTLWRRNDNINFKCRLVSTSLFGILQTISGFTPSANTVKTIRLSGHRV